MVRGALISLRTTNCHLSVCSQNLPLVAKIAMMLLRAFLVCSICVAVHGFSISNPTTNKKHVIMKRPDDFTSRESTRSDDECAFILFPGCHLKPEAYEQLASSIQLKSSAWVHIPKLPFNMATPWTINACLERAIQDLADAGFTGKDIIVGGHSLGGTFLQKAVASFNSKATSTFSPITIKGMVYLACFQARGTKTELPCLTVSGDLDGLIRVSRIAEDCYNNVIKTGDTAAARLNHAIVLVPGMVSTPKCTYIRYSLETASTDDLLLPRTTT